MAEKRLGIVGLALGHPIGFADRLARMGFRPTALVRDEHEEEERRRTAILTEKWPDLKVYGTVGALISGGIDCVICSSQAWRHLDDCRELIENRIPLFIDKPLAPGRELAEKILNLVEKHDAPMMSCSVRRFSANYGALIEAVRANKAGTLLWAECFEPHGTTPGYWQDVKSKSGGLIVNYGIHTVDPIVRLMGTNVASVFAVKSKNVLTDADSEDTGIVTIRFENDTVAVCKVSGAYAFGTGKPVPTVGHLKVHCSGAALETFIDESDVKVYRGGNFGVDRAYSDKAGDLAALSSFADMTVTGKRPVPIGEMLATMKILDAARRSADTGELVRP